MISVFFFVYLESVLSTDDTTQDGRHANPVVGIPLKCNCGINYKLNVDSWSGGLYKSPCLLIYPINGFIAPKALNYCRGIRTHIHQHNVHH